MSDLEYVKQRKSYDEKAKSAKTNGMKFTTVSGQDINVLYGPDDIENINCQSGRNSAKNNTYGQ